MKQLIANIIGRILHKAFSSYTSYRNYEINKQLGGGKRRIQYPYYIQGVENIIASQPISIGRGSTILTTRAKLIIKHHFVSGPNLTVVTGDHMPIIGRYIDTVKDSDKDLFDINHDYDKDVVIGEDVWCGANVTILKGVSIGRGSIIAAGAIVTKDMPPYCVVGGIPAKVVKRRMSIEEIMDHENKLYPEQERYTHEQLYQLLLQV